MCSCVKVDAMVRMCCGGMVRVWAHVCVIAFMHQPLLFASVHMVTCELV